MSSKQVLLSHDAACDHVEDDPELRPSTSPTDMHTLRRLDSALDARAHAIQTRAVSDAVRVLTAVDSASKSASASASSTSASTSASASTKVSDVDMLKASLMRQTRRSDSGNVGRAVSLLEKDDLTMLEGLF